MQTHLIAANLINKKNIHEYIGTVRAVDKKAALLSRTLPWRNSEPRCANSLESATSLKTWNSPHESQGRVGQLCREIAVRVRQKCRQHDSSSTNSSTLSDGTVFPKELIPCRPQRQRESSVISTWRAARFSPKERKGANFCSLFAEIRHARERHHTSVVGAKANAYRCPPPSPSASCFSACPYPQMTLCPVRKVKPGRAQKIRRRPRRDGRAGN